jgi:hypothetical protein
MMKEHEPRESIELLAVRIPTAQAMLGLGRSKLYDLMDSGAIRTVKAGRARLVIVQSIRDFISRSSGA